MKQQDLKRPSGYSFVTVAPRTSQDDNPALRRLKLVQDQERNNWKGLNIESIGRVHPISSSNTFDTMSLKSHQERCLTFLQPYQSQENFIVFTPVTDKQIVRDQPSATTYGKTRFWQTKELLYRLIKGDGKIVRSTLEQQGFRFTDTHDWNILWMSSSPKPYLYDGLNEHQRINHFPYSNEITRKDKMCSNLLNMQEIYGKEDFDFFPDTYILPEEFAEFYSQFHNDRNQTWIVKPSSSSQGRGIYLVDSIDQVPIDEGCVISKYVKNPLLINSLKFDLRIYVLTTCFDPLKIYVYSEGLARFATEAYSPDSKSNRYIHLTNYSVNKKSSNFVQNNDPTKDDIGSKWSLSALFRHLQSVGVDTDLLWSKISDLIIKSIVSIEPIVVEGVKKHGLQRSNCFDLMGFDILIDSNLKPWLLEVNLSPSLAADSPLDLFIKGNLIADAFNLIGLRIFDRKKESLNKVKSRLRAKYAQQAFTRRGPLSRAQISSKKVENTAQSQRFQEIIRQTASEFMRKGNFQRIYPSHGSDIYEKYFQQPRLANQALYYGLFTLMSQFIPNIQRPFTTGGIESRQVVSANDSIIIPEDNSRRCCHCKDIITDTNLYQCQRCKQQYLLSNEKLVITGDDVLIEYISRLRFALKSISQDQIRPDLKLKIEAFIFHPVWNGQERRTGNAGMKLWQRLDYRLIEMKERKRRLMAQKGIQSNPQEKKNTIVRGLSAIQLEEMLCKTTKNVAKELVDCLFDNNIGALSEIMKILAQNQADNRLDQEQNDDTIVSQKRFLQSPGMQSNKATGKALTAINWKGNRRPITGYNKRNFVN